MSNKYNKFITALFCTFLGGMLVVSTLLPDKEMSELENRYLQKPPKFSVETVTDGTFMEQAEDYVADHIAGRDFWVAAKAWCERLSGKRENNGVYFGKQDTLLNRVDTPAWEDTPAQAGVSAKQGLLTRRQCVCPGVPGHHPLLLCHLGRPPARWCAHSGRVFPH